MKQVNVVATISFDKQAIPIDLNKISDIGPEVKVVDCSELLAREQSGDFSAKKEFDEILNDADVIFAAGLPGDILRRAPRLKWIQTMGAGVDRFLDEDIVNSPVVMTNASGINAVPISEYILCVMLMFAKQMPFCYLSKQEKKWEHRDATSLSGKTAGIVGLGHIGREVARLCKGFGMKVIATRRSATEKSKARYVDELLPPRQLPRLLSGSDFVALTLPLTLETTHLIGKEEFLMMKPSSYIINVGRGNIVDEAALILALKNRLIAGAGLDVFSREPLPPDSELWNLPNVIISPHISGSTGKMEDDFSKTTSIFSENLKRFLGGKRLLHMVNKKRGY